MLAPILVVATNGKYTWEGAGNVYAVPHVYSHDGVFPRTIAAWRTLHKSDADSFEDVSPQIDPGEYRIRVDGAANVRRHDGRDFGADESRIPGARR